MYVIDSALHTACLLLHYPLLLSAPAFSTPAFSVAHLIFFLTSRHKQETRAARTLAAAFFCITKL